MFDAAETHASRILKPNAEAKADALDMAVHGLARTRPSASASHLLTRGQAVIAILLLIGVAALLALAPLAGMIAINAALTGFFLIQTLIRLGLFVLGQSSVPTPEQDTAPIKDCDLPSVTILLPVYDEAECLGGLVSAIGALDYPPDKIQALLLVEEDDAKTRHALAMLPHRSLISVLIVPPSHPRTKPKACNYGLYFAQGELTVIYDAEDRPMADQLREAAQALSRGGDKLACVQAPLNFYNQRDTWLTRLFTLEYALWFDHLLPGLSRLGAPIPLGGTSNIFKTSALRAVGGWDPYNVTEDADLGLRLARAGYKTTLINSTTLEEANCETLNWIRQRSRWLKGFTQTWLVHMRRHDNRAELGWRGALTNHVILAGTVLSSLVAPVLWAVFGLALLSDGPDLDMLFPAPLNHFALVSLIAGNMTAITMLMIAPLRRDRGNVGWAAILAPLYWALASIAAYKAMWQLIRKPFYWEKTRHGLTNTALKARGNSNIGLPSRAKP